MRIAVLGAGGVGGYFGALLARAGHDVVLFARGANLAAIQADGIVIRDDEGEFSVPIAATDSPASLGRPDLVIVTVKSYSLSEVAPVARTLAAAGGAILPLLNGVEAADDLERSGVARSQILGGLTNVSAHKEAPGVIRRALWKQRVVLGELDGQSSERAERFAGALRDGGIDASTSNKIVVDLWRKFNQLCAMAAACGMARTTVGVMRSTPLGHQLIERAVYEIAAVGRARGVAIPSDQEAEVVAAIDALPGTMKPSFVLDVERGDQTELAVLSGAVSRFGRECGVPTPIHDTATAVLSAREA
jgi:2-dehydropantoate 2-reductase